MRFLKRDDTLPKRSWELDEDWEWFIGKNREKIRLTTQPEPYTLERALNWVQRQVAPTIKMLQELDKQNNTTILKDMINNTELKKKHKHLLELEKSNIEDRIYTKRHFQYRYDVNEEKYNFLSRKRNKSYFTVQICYGRRKSNYFHFMEANRLLLSLYEVKEEKVFRFG